MASSGSVDFSVSRDELIISALRAARIIGQDQTPTDREIKGGAQALNMLVKQWQGRSDFAKGLKIWSRKTGYVFLALDTLQYALGPTGDHATSSYRATSLLSAKSANAGTFTVVSASGISTSDYIGILLDDGSLAWTTVTGTSGALLSIPTNTIGLASAGATVFAYTTKIRRPLEVLTAVMRNLQNEDVPLWPITREQYEAIPDKTASGTPRQYVYEPSLTNGTLVLESPADDVTNVIRLTFWGALEDLDATTDTLDFPQEWFRAFKFNLAIDLWVEYKQSDPPKSLMALAGDSLMMAQSANPEDAEIWFEPNR